MRDKIIACDFDGTLCEYAFPNIGAPRWEIINRLKKEIENGSKVILWTCRDGKQLTEAIDWCLSVNIKLAAVNQNLPSIINSFGGDTRKVVADEYWDDRNINVMSIGKV